MKDGYVIGVDFGSDSVRCVVVDITDGTTCAEAESGYARWLDKKYQTSRKNFVSIYRLSQRNELTFNRKL